MNRLLIAKRVQILSLLCEGSSMRAISRLVDVSSVVDHLFSFEDLVAIVDEWESAQKTAEVI